MLTDNDHADFQHAIQLIRAIVDRHPTDVTAPTIVALQVAVHDIQLLERYLGSVNP